VFIAVDLVDRDSSECLTVTVPVPFPGLLFPKFRFGWEMTLHCISQKPSSKPSLSTFMVVAVKGSSAVGDQIMSSFDHSSIDCNREQVTMSPSPHPPSHFPFPYCLCSEIWHH